MTDDIEIMEFDTADDYPNGFRCVHIGMTHTVNKDEHPSWMPQYRPNIVVTATEEISKYISAKHTFGIKNIDACIIEVTKNISASVHGYGNHELFLDNVKRISGYRSKYNSADRSMNTGRIIIEMNE